MSKDNGKNPMPNNNGKNPMPNDYGKGLMFNAFPNLRGSRLSGANLRAPPSLITQPGAFSSTNSGQPFASSPQSFARPNIKKPDLEYLGYLLGLMTCPTRYSEFHSYLERIDTYETDHKKKMLFTIGSILTTNHFTFVDLATHQYGSQALKTLLKRNPSLIDRFIYEAVCINFSVLMNSKYSHNLIVDVIRAVDKFKKESLYELTYINALFLAEQETGCIALNNVFQEIKGKFRELIFGLVALNADRLAFDPYGTHVVQNFVTLKNPRATRAIAVTLFGSFFRLAMERQGSYLVEKCLKSDQGREIVLIEFRKNDREWVRMASHRYGNFVTQCALLVMKERGMKAMLREFVEKLRPHFGSMEIGHGKNTLKVIEEKIEDYLLELPYNLLGFMH
ncbi:unnamed protein product [Arabis nemorensis]|uniref:PUM-HD domain-containing protein n=1 Tax=Arabis nemorensis TaxID=586526 RepID=A0A565CJN4_9BRAS|nr:unnamed protein product [Arabis nemorensis]